VTSDRDSLSRDLEAAVAARADLGREYEPALVESFVDRVEEAIERRVNAEASRRSASAEPPDPRFPFVLGIVSLGTGVPITAIAAGTEGLAGLVVAWGGIVGVNLAYAVSRARRR